MENAAFTAEFNIGKFRKSFPEFADTAAYPNEMVCMWGELAVMQVNCRRWRNATEKGVFLYTAHEVTLAARNLKVGNMGGTPGDSAGPVNSKTVGPITTAYDTQQAAEKDAGYWNLTSYGKQFIRLARLFGAGPLQIR